MHIDLNLDNPGPSETANHGSKNWGVLDTQYQHVADGLEQKQPVWVETDTFQK